MSKNEAAGTHRPIFWSPLYLTAILYPVVMGVPLLICWQWLSASTFLGISYDYLGASMALAASLYAIVWLWGWWETPRRKIEDRPFIRWAERLCRVGKLARWDGVFALGLFLAFLPLLLLSPFTGAEAFVPVAALLIAGNLANLLRLEVEDKQAARHLLNLKQSRQQRQRQVSEARAAGDRRIPTLRLADARKAEELESAEKVILDLRWSYTPYSSINAATRWYEVEIPANLEHYREFRRLDHDEKGAHCEGYALRALALPDEELRELAWELELLAREASFCPLDTAGLALALVQSILYAGDRASTGQAEYGRYPLETLVDGKGDCDCHAILAAALLVRLGFDVLLVYIPQVEAGRPDSAHMGVAVAGQEDIPGDQWYRFEGRKYYYVETTSPGVRLGEFPQEWVTREHYPLRLR